MIYLQAIEIQYVSYFSNRTFQVRFSK